jgi:hypothetical protein
LGLLERTNLFYPELAISDEAHFDLVKRAIQAPSTCEHDLHNALSRKDELVEQARGIYGGDSKIAFEQADVTENLPLGEHEKPYDLYFASYGAWSHHNEDETMIRLMTEIAQRTEDSCLVVCDWLGRYSYEWQSLRTSDLMWRSRRWSTLIDPCLPAATGTQPNTVLAPSQSARRSIPCTNFDVRTDPGTLLSDLLLEEGF